MGMQRDKKDLVSFIAIKRHDIPEYLCPLRSYEVQNRERDADSWAGVVLEYYKTSVQLYSEPHSNFKKVKKKYV